LALKVNSLVGIERPPDSLALVAGIGALLAMSGNPFFGRMSDRTSSRLGMRRPWMVIGLVGGSVGILVVALAPSIAVVLVGRCTAQLIFNALLAAMVAVLPDQVPATQRGLVRRSPGCLYAYRVGERHLPGQAVHRQPGRHVLGAVRDRRVFHPALRGHAEGAPAGQGGPSAANFPTERAGGKSSYSPHRPCTAGRCS
jgi:hypothetical protein